MTPLTKFQSEVVAEVVRQEPRDPRRTRPCDACHCLGAERIWSQMGCPAMYQTCWTCDGWGWLLPAPVSRYLSGDLAA